MTGTGSYCTAVCCIDGRIHGPLVDWLRHTLSVDYVDLITEPGPERALTQSWRRELDVKERVQVSVRAHGTRVAALVAHHGCAANPSPEQEQLRELRQAVERIRGWQLFADVLALYVDGSRVVRPVE